MGHVETAHKPGMMSPSVSVLLAEKQDIWGYSVASEYTAYFNPHFIRGLSWGRTVFAIKYVGQIGTI